MRYRAFFSYARADDRLAKWLHRKLDGYRTPRRLVGAAGELGPVPATLHPIFRDRTDLEAGGSVNDALNQALQDSDCLIVLCTPSSAKSRWVDRECAAFLELGRQSRIFPVIGAGEPDSGDAETECFPPSLRGKGLLAADLREMKLSSGQLVGDGREGGRFKLIAGLLGLPLDRLMQRERRRQRQLVSVLAVAAATFFVVAAVAAVQTLEANKNLNLAQSNAQKARDTLHRFFATRAWDSLRAHEYARAVRYALAGMRVSPVNAAEYRAVLASTMHAAGESVALSGERAVDLVRFSADGAHLLALEEDGDLVLWDVERRSSKHLVAGDRLSDFGFSQDGKEVLASFAGVPAIRRWSASSGDELAVAPGSQLHVASNGIASLTNAAMTDEPCGSSAVEVDVSRISRRVLCITDTGEILVRGAGSSGPAVRKLMELETTEGLLPWEITWAQFSPDERFVVSGGSCIVWVHDADTLDVVSELEGTGGAFSPDGKIFAIANVSSVDVYSGDDLGLARPAPINTLYGHSDTVSSLAFSSDGSRLASASYDGSVRVWSMIAGRELEHADDSQGGALLSTINWRRESQTPPADVARFQKAAAEHMCSQPAHGSAPNAVRALFSAEGRVCVVDRESGSVVAAADVPGKWPVVALSADGRYLLAPVDDSRLQLIEIGSDTPALTIQTLVTDVSSLSFSPDGNAFVVAGRNGVVQMWRRSSGELLWTRREQQAPVKHVQFISGDRLIVGLEGEVALVLESQTGKTISSFEDRVDDGSRLSQDGTVLFARSGSVWDTATGVRIAELKGEIPTGEMVLLSEDENHAATINNTDHFDGYVWSVNRLPQAWGPLARDACNLLLGQGGRRFSREEIAADPLLTDAWSIEADVCEGINGVDPVVPMKTSAK